MGLPRKLLLATDLTARSDRAADRAMFASAQCGAEIVALHVLEPHARAPESVRSNEERARDLMAYDLRAARVVAGIEVAIGDPAEVALQVARANGCGLIVTGVARADKILGPTLGGTVDKLLRISDLPLLIVTERARGAYEHIVVAVDFSPASRDAVRTAAAWFPHATLTLFHAFDAPPSVAMPDRQRLDGQFHDAAEARYHEFVRDLALLSPPMAMLRRGDPETLIRQLASSRAADLVVIGTHGRGRLAEMLLGSVAKRILGHLVCDALVVPPPA